MSGSSDSSVGIATGLRAGRTRNSDPIRDRRQESVLFVASSPNLEPMGTGGSYPEVTWSGHETETDYHLALRISTRESTSISLFLISLHGVVLN
jgi:hypothetical protein